MNKQGYGFAPGACGELLQGQFETGEDFLVSLPIDIWSKANIEISGKSPEIIVSPKTKFKTAQAVRILLNQLGHPALGAHIQIKSEIPEGKGLASSTADIVAVCYAVGDALGAEITPNLISSIAGQIEPSDGVMYPGLVVYNHRKCELIQELGRVPSINILVIDLGGVVDTLNYNQNPKIYSAEEQALCQENLEQLKQGIDQKNWHKIGQASTRSSRVNQRFLHKPELEKIISVTEEHNAYGICAAHSGTVVGILLDSENAPLSQMRAAVLSVLNRPLEIFMIKTITDEVIQ